MKGVNFNEKVNIFYSGNSILGLIVYGCGIPLKPVVPSSEESELDTKGPSDCVTIKDRTLLRSDGVPIVLGYDEWGYNYQAHMFNGGYCDAYRDAAWCQPYKDIQLIMKWNGAWLSNKDCDGDSLLDRHHGYDSYIGSGAWLTNHQSGEYEGEDGEICKWNYFCKIVAVSSDAVLSAGVWYTVDGDEIGEAIWGAFAIIQQIENDLCAGIHGAQYISPCGPGFGQYGSE